MGRDLEGPDLVPKRSFWLALLSFLIAPESLHSRNAEDPVNWRAVRGGRTLEINAGPAKPSRSTQDPTFP